MHSPQKPPAALELPWVGILRTQNTSGQKLVKGGRLAIDAGVYSRQTDLIRSTGKRT